MLCWYCQELLEFKRQRDVKRVELGKRRSAASQNRMRIISSLGAEVAVKKGKQQGGEDTFGMDDSDWNVYRTIVSSLGVWSVFIRGVVCAHWGSGLCSFGVWSVLIEGMVCAH